jgi:hypothetical protein
MTMLRLLCALMLCFLALPAAAQSVDQPPPGSQIVASAASPSATLKVNVTLNGEGRVGYMVSRLGKPVIAESSQSRTDRPRASIKAGTNRGASIGRSATATPSSPPASTRRIG